jgi:hypothetical protein
MSAKQNTNWSRFMGKRSVLPWEAAFPGVIAAIRADAPHATFHDATFPAYLPASTLKAAGVWTLRRDAECRFLETFRSPDRKHVAAFTAEIARAYAPPHPHQGWLIVDAIADISPLLATLAATHWCVLVVNWSQSDHARRELVGWQVKPFEGPDGEGTTFAALLPLVPDVPETMANGPSPKAGMFRGQFARVLKKIDPRSSVWRMGSGPEQPLPWTFTAGELSTDAAYPIETDRDHVWIWTGPDVTTRFTVGRLPSSAKRLLVWFSASRLHGDLDQTLSVQLDGLTVRSTCAVGRDGEGHVSLEVDPARVPAPIIGVSRSTSFVPEPGGRTLRVSIAGMEVRTW